MKIDKDTLLSLLRHAGHEDKAQDAQAQLPDQIDTDDEQHKNLLGRLGIDPAMIQGLAAKMPEDLRSKLPGGLGKLLG